ncbi:MAG: DNA repair protein RadC [Chloroflexi bacterium]|nr:DNA repair protein RadC [Chloroflexota bacterium]
MHTRDEFNKVIEDIGHQSRWIDPARFSSDLAELDEFLSTEAVVEIASVPNGDPGCARRDEVEGKVCDVDFVQGGTPDSDDNLEHTPPRERPRERMHELGPAGITTTELLAILLGSGIRGKNVKNLADDLLREFDGLRGLSRISSFNMQTVGGIGSINADKLTAAFELGRRAAQEQVETAIGDYGSHMPNGDAIAHSVAKQFTAKLRDNAQEEMWIVLLDVRNQYRGKVRVYVGCCDQLVAKTGEILNRVVERNLPRYALVHNHPSGNGEPSGADISFTERLVRAGQLLDIELVDHIVLGEDLHKYVSMRQRNLVDFIGTSRADRKVMDGGANLAG